VAGNPGAEERLIELYGRSVAVLLARHTNGRPEAEDLFQDTFRIAIEKLRRGELREAEKLPGFLAGIARSLAIEHERTAGTVAAYRQQLENERRRAADLGRKLAVSETGRADERRQLSARHEAAEKAGKAAPWNEVLFNTPVFLLRTFRDEPGNPPAVIDLAKVDGPLSIAVDVGADTPGFSSYSVRMIGNGGRGTFAKGGLRPNALDALLITFPGGFFAPGEYRLNVFGVAKDGKETALGSHPFRVLAGGFRHL
jgi:hypothetical protein